MKHTDICEYCKKAIKDTVYLTTKLDEHEMQIRDFHFCSEECAKKHNYINSKVGAVFCAICGAPIPAYSASSTPIYCSIDCYHKALDRKYRVVSKPLKTYTCARCGNAFTGSAISLKDSRTNMTLGNYCCYRCAELSRNEIIVTTKVPLSATSPEDEQDNNSEAQNSVNHDDF